MHASRSRRVDPVIIWMRGGLLSTAVAALSILHSAVCAPAQCSLLHTVAEAWPCCCELGGCGGGGVSCVAYVGVLSCLPGRSPAGTVHAQLAVGVTLVSAALRAKIGVLHPRLLWLVKAYHTRPHPCRKSTMREDGMMSGHEP